MDSAKWGAKKKKRLASHRAAHTLKTHVGRHHGHSLPGSPTAGVFLVRTVFFFFPFLPNPLSPAPAGEGSPQESARPGERQTMALPRKHG